MDRDALLGTLPPQAAFNGMFPYQRKEAVETFIGSILDAIAADDREPDDWESHDIAAAVGYVAARMYYAALTIAIRALAPPEERSPLQPRQENDPLAARQLREALDFVRGMPARNY